MRLAVPQTTTPKPQAAPQASAPAPAPTPPPLKVAAGTSAAPSPLQAKFAAARAALQAALIERDEEIDLALTALVAQEHLLLVGPPGVAKSLLLDSIMDWMGGSRFTMLVNKFSTPEELYGPVSVKGLKEDKYVRITSGRLPEAHGAFLDEVFKGSSAILNTLLRILNERLFDAGDGSLKKVPLRLCVAASNEWPGSQEGGQELGPLFDRFLIRKTVKPIMSASGKQRLRWGGSHVPTFTDKVTPSEVDAAAAEAAALPWSTEAQAAYDTILRELAKEGIFPSDRRDAKAVGICQAYAWLAGASQVNPEHLEVLAHVLWMDPAEQPARAAQVVAKIANPVGMVVNGLLLEAEQILASVDVKHLASVTSATTKLTDIGKQLSPHKGHPKADKARQYIWDAIQEIKKQWTAKSDEAAF
jgi:MoxR-like ATPase